MGVSLETGGISLQSFITNFTLILTHLLTHSQTLAATPMNRISKVELPLSKNKSNILLIVSM